MGQHPNNWIYSNESCWKSNDKSWGTVFNDLVVSSSPSTTITSSNLVTDGTCTPSSTTIGTVIGKCDFALTGAVNNNYILPTNPITANISSAPNSSPVSQSCVIQLNATAQATLSCPSIPTAGATSGNQTTRLSLGTASAPVLLSYDPCTNGSLNSSAPACNICPTGTLLINGTCGQRPVTELELASVIICTPNNVVVNTTVTCTGQNPLAPEIAMTGLKLKIGINGTEINCTVDANRLVTCPPSTWAIHLARKILSFLQLIRPQSL